MPTDPGTVNLRFRVLLVPLAPDGAEQHDHPIDGGIVEVAMHVGIGRPGPVMRDAGLDRYVEGIVQRDTQANEIGRPRGQATDPGFVPGVGTPADVAARARGVTTPRPIRDSPQA